jgi:hypothetical protein
MYVRIARGKTDYALFPKDIDINDLVAKNGKDLDYYQSVYEYTDDHYNRFLEGLQEACKYTEIPFSSTNLINITSKVRAILKKKSREGNIKADELQKSISVAGINDLKTKKLVFDFDSIDDINAAKTDTMQLIARLVSNGVPADKIQICFSGGKGFSIELLTTTTFNKDEFVAITSCLAGDLKTFDTKVKDHQRLFRIPLTKHVGSGLYKIPLTHTQLGDMPIDVIKKMAEAPTKEHYDIVGTWSEIELPSSVIDLKNKSTDAHKKDDYHSRTFSEKLDLSHKPTWLSPSKYALQEGFFQDGSRNHAFMILASTYKNNGFDKEMCKAMLERVAKIQAERETRRLGKPVTPYPITKLWTEVIEYVYGSSWNGGMYSSEHDELLRSTSENLGLPTVEENKIRLIESPSVRDTFREFASKIDDHTVKLGIPEIDNNFHITTSMVVHLLGAPSSGKTSFSLGFLEYVSKTGGNSIYYSLDMASPLIYTRMLQRTLRMTSEEIYYKMSTGLEPELKSGYDTIDRDFKNVSFCFKGGITVDDIEEDVIKYKAEKGSLRLVVVDYLECINGPFSDPNANMGHIAGRLKQIANEQNICIIVLVQPQKSIGDPSEALLSMRNVKGSSRLEQDARLIMTLWRPGFSAEDPQYDKYACVAVVKNNMGSLGKYDFIWDGLSGKVKGLSLSEREDFNKALEVIKLRKLMQNGANGNDRL